MDAVLAAALRLERLAASASESLRIVGVAAAKGSRMERAPIDHGGPSATTPAEHDIAARLTAAKRASGRIRSTSPVQNIKVYSANGKEEFMLNWPAVEEALRTGRIINVPNAGFFFVQPM